MELLNTVKEELEILFGKTSDDLGDDYRFISNQYIRKLDMERSLLP